MSATIPAQGMEPCPCCAGDLTLHDTDWCEPIEYFARCDACGLHFPGSIDRQAAITIANRRPARDARAAVIKECAQAAHDAACQFLERKDAFVLSGPMGIALAMVAAVRSLANRSALPR